MPASTGTKAKTTKKAAAQASAAKAATAKAPSAKAAGGKMTLAEVMKALEKLGTAQTKKTYARHGAQEPMYGVLFGDLKTLQKRLGVDHDLALALWDTGNFDARNLAFRLVDPTLITAQELNRWARDTTVRMCCGYVASLAAESPHGTAKVAEWLDSADESERCSGWGLVGQIAMRSTDTPEAWFAKRLDEIVSGIHSAPNAQREPMNMALICIGGRSPALKKAALAASKRVGKVEVDYGDTSCKTPDAAPYIEKMWAHATSKGFASPSAQEQSRESQRTRC